MVRISKLKSLQFSNNSFCANVRHCWQKHYFFPFFWRNVIWFFNACKCQPSLCCESLFQVLDCLVNHLQCCYFIVLWVCANLLFVSPHKWAFISQHYEDSMKTDLTVCASELICLQYCLNTITSFSKLIRWSLEWQICLELCWNLSLSLIMLL